MQCSVVAFAFVAVMYCNLISVLWCNVEMQCSCGGGSSSCCCSSCSVISVVK